MINAILKSYNKYDYRRGMITRATFIYLLVAYNTESYETQDSILCRFFHNMLSNPRL